MNNLTPFLGTSLTDVFLVNPKSFDDADGAIIRLKAGHLVLVNTKHLTTNSSQRIIDYLAGSVQSLDGQFTEAGNGVYLFSPSTLPTQKISSFTTGE